MLTPAHSHTARDKMKITKRQLKRVIREQLNEAYIPIELDIEVITDETGVTTIDSRSAEEIAFKIADAYDIINDLTILLDTSIPRPPRLDPRVQGLIDQLGIAEDAIYDAQMYATHVADGTGS